jgi:Family of unknown function (DUF5675)
MTLRLVREPSSAGATLGVLFVNGRFECFTLEDQIRERAGEPVHAWKVPAQTAIPAGRYQIVVTESVRFKRPLPLLIGVPGFAGIRVHPGNRISDTEGCILPGLTRSSVAVGQSRAAFDLLFAKIRRALAAGEQVWIRIDNPDVDEAVAA